MQTIANIYRNFPNQHTLLITHSNQALNQLFEKIVDLDINPKHLLRLGHGEEDLEIQGSGGDWGKMGRVNSFLERRIKLLQDVDRLAAILDVSGAHGNSCETAGYFYKCHVQPRCAAVLSSLESCKSAKEVIDGFPFLDFFTDTPEPLFKGCKTYATAAEIARDCVAYLESVFSELEELRAFELLRNAKDRCNYLLVKEAKIVALTCTHAALKRRELVKLGFKYDNIVMEEAAQILEVESFIPLVLQSPDCDNSEGPTSRLKRVVLIGDHRQLPPIVQNAAFQSYSNLEQSMFSRLVRLGVPTITLDQQGRCRSSLSPLFKWVYPGLGDLETVTTRAEFSAGNPGFKWEYQLVNVPDYMGKGESEPAPHYIQNLGEAEYVVGVYMYMRILGYADFQTFHFPRIDILQRKSRFSPPTMDKRI